MSIRNYTKDSIQPWKDIYCNEMNCDVMNVDDITVDNITVSDLTVSTSLTTPLIQSATLSIDGTTTDLDATNLNINSTNIVFDNFVSGSLTVDGAGVLSVSAGGSATSGDYTPTIGIVSNVSAVAPHVSRYLRIGDMVNITYSFEFTATAAPAQMTVSLPINTNSPFTGAFDGYGPCVLFDGSNTPSNSLFTIANMGAIDRFTCLSNEIAGSYFAFGTFTYTLNP